MLLSDELWFLLSELSEDSSRFCFSREATQQSFDPLSIDASSIRFGSDDCVSSPLLVERDSVVSRLCDIFGGIPEADRDACASNDAVSDGLDRSFSGRRGSLDSLYLVDAFG